MQFHDRHGEGACLANIEGDFAAIRRPIGFRAIAEARGDVLARAAGGGDAVKLRAAVVIVGVNDFVAVGRPCWGGFDAGRVGEAMGAAVEAADIELRVAILAEGAGDAVATGGEGGAGVGAGVFDDAVAGAGGEIDEVNISVAGLIAGVGEQVSIGRKAGADGDGIVMGELLDGGAVEIGKVDLLAAGACGVKAMREPAIPRLPVRVWMMSLAKAWALARASPLYVPATAARPLWSLTFPSSCEPLEEPPAMREALPGLERMK